MTEPDPLFVAHLATQVYKQVDKYAPDNNKAVIAAVIKRLQDVKDNMI